MEQSTTAGIPRLAQQAAKLTGRHEAYYLLKEQIERMQRLGRTVRGDIDLCRRLDEDLKQADKLLRDLVKDENDNVQEQKISMLEELFDNVDWDLAPDYAEELKGKADREEARLQQEFDENEQKLVPWKQRLQDLDVLIRKAKDVRAPLRSEEKQFEDLKSNLESATANLLDKEYDKMDEWLKELSRRYEPLCEKIKQNKEQVASFSQRFDLVLVKSELEGDLHKYTVMLRKFGEAKKQAVNIHDVSEIDEEERDLMRETIDTITEAVNHRLTRSFVEKQAQLFISSAEESTEDPTGDPQQLEEQQEDALRDLVLYEGPADGQALDVNRQIKKIGNLMYRLIIPDRIKPFLRDNGTFSITTNDLELPWEFLWPGHFLCLERPVSRMPIGRATPLEQFGTEGEEDKPKKVRFLFLYADPDNNLPQAKWEVERIQSELKSKWQEFIETDFLNNPRGLDITELLPEGNYDVIHYAGHAAFDGDDPDSSALQFFDKKFESDKIRRLVGGRPLVFLNACETARIANEGAAQQVESYFQEPAAGLASAFMYGGAPACIGAMWPIYDKPAADFAVKFYGFFLQGYTVGEAMRRTRNAIRAEHESSITWASYVLFGDPMHRI